MSIGEKQNTLTTTSEERSGSMLPFFPSAVGATSVFIKKVADVASSKQDSNAAGVSTQRAFTLIELLVVIAIIGLLSSVVLASLSGARENARKTAAEAELNQLRTGIELLLNDTGKWPNGCPPGSVSNPEVDLNDQSGQAGLLSAPSAADQGGGCVWTSDDVAEWNGPYVESDELVDPWGRSYQFDPDYIPYDDDFVCTSKPQQSVRPVVFSEGPSNPGGYDCDDIWVNLN